jgi:coatomer protein complex subunit alpha (xenin)
MEQDTNEDSNFVDASATEDDTGAEISDLLAGFKEKENPASADILDETGPNPDDEIDPLASGEKWGDEIDLDDDILGDVGEAGDPDLADLDAEINEEAKEQEVFVPPTRSNDPLKQIVANSMIPAHHVAIGNFREALDLLKKQIGLANPRPLRNVFSFVHSNSRISIPSLSKCPSISAILRTADGANPYGIIDHEFLKRIYKEGFNETTKGNFKQALLSFQKCIQYATLAVATTTDEEKEIKKLISGCVEYTLAMKIELKRRDKNLTTTEDQNLELACLMAVCKLHPSHKFLALKNAMNLCYKAQNFITAAHLARSILDLESKGVFKNKPELIQQYKKYYAAFQKKGTNKLKLSFDIEACAKVEEANGFVCCGSLKPFPETLLGNRNFKSSCKCPFTGAIYSEEYSGKICTISNITEIGSDALGLSILDQRE